MYFSLDAKIFSAIVHIFDVWRSNMNGKSSLPIFYDENKKCQGVTYVRSGTRKLLILVTTITCIVYFFYGIAVFTKFNLRESTNEDLADYFIEGTPPPLLPEHLFLNAESERLTQKLPLTHVFLASAYYYPTSKSLGNNAIALNLVLDSNNSDASIQKFIFLGSNSTHLVSGAAVPQIQKSEKCRYSSAVALGNSVKNLVKIELKSNGTTIEIPFKTARYTAPKPVIICISPQFIADNWQIFLMQVHTANRFGAHLHIYVTVTSLMKSYFELMKEYENQGYLTIEMWLRMKFKEPGNLYFEPNLNTEEANRAGAFSDCLLQYKEAADYITFFDMEDVLFPLKYPTYLEEFSAEWAMNPGASFLVYGVRDHEFLKANTLIDYNFHELVDSLITSSSSTGRTVVKPALHNNSWSYQENIIRIGHPHVIRMSISKTQNPESRFNRFNETIHQNDVIAIHDDIMRMKNVTEISRISMLLPTLDFYSKIVRECKLKQETTTCPNIEKCKIPQTKNIKCMHTDAEYVSGPTTGPFVFHYFINPIWSSDYGCYQ